MIDLNGEFVKAIMSVLRLDPNIYITGAIEQIIDRIEVDDYQMFIAYLGERKADYEKPIENIAKGVDEFYQLKMEPYIKKSKAIKERLSTGISGVLIYIENSYTPDCLDNNDVERIVKNEYGKQSKEVQEIARQEITMRLLRNERNKAFDRFKNKNKDDEFFKKFRYSSRNERVFDDDMLDVVFKLGGFSECIDDYGRFCKSEDEILKVLIGDKIKFSIKDKIRSSEVIDNSYLVIENIKRLVQKKQ